MVIGMPVRTTGFLYVGGWSRDFRFLVRSSSWTSFQREGMFSYRVAMKHGKRGATTTTTATMRPKI